MEQQHSNYNLTSTTSTSTDNLSANSVFCILSNSSHSQSASTFSINAAIKGSYRYNMNGEDDGNNDSGCKEDADKDGGSTQSEIAKIRVCIGKNPGQPLNISVWIVIE